MEGPPQKKKKRTENWSSADKALLKNLVADNIEIIENKSTDTNTNKSKKQCWESILNLFNAASNVPREVSQLQFQWRGMKLKAKKQESEYRKTMNATGGGPAPKLPDNECADLMLLVPNEFKRDSNNFDSDAQQTCQQNNETEDVSNLENNINANNISEASTTADVKNIPLRENSSRFVQRRNICRTKKFSNNEETRYKAEIFELTKAHMIEEHNQRMENLLLEKECRKKELRKLEVEIDSILSKK